MKVSLFLLTLILTINTYSQSEKSLEETKAYILKITNQYGELKDGSKINVEFYGDLLSVKSGMGKLFGSPIYYETLYDFKNVYRFKGPLRKSGNIGEIVIWVDATTNSKSYRWKKNVFKINMIDYQASEQLMIALQHLNKLLKNKTNIEKF
ncbi:MAG: hypothetical protein JNJ52_01290 [Flavobacterium sp.]|nr:hypothetical protein [Flavobacterium sp.]